jgi:hypothetical protein
MANLRYLSNFSDGDTFHLEFSNTFLMDFLAELVTSICT